MNRHVGRAAGSSRTTLNVNVIAPSTTLGLRLSALTATTGALDAALTGLVLPGFSVNEPLEETIGVDRNDPHVGRLLLPTV